MSVVVFQCSECEREIELVQNKKTLEVVNNCIITEGCSGYLRQTNVLVDYSKGKLPEPVSGLTDWSQRKVLYNHTQSIEDTVWTIKHNLNCVPTFIVLVDKPTQANPDYREKIEPTDVIVLNNNTIEFHFGRPYSGIAQLLTNTSFPVVQNTNQTAVSTKFQLSNNGELTFGVLKSLSIPTHINMTIKVIPSIGLSRTETLIIDDVQSINSPWRSNNFLLIKGSIFHLRSFNIRDNVVLSTGSSVSFQVDTPNQFFLMLSNPPHSIFDVVRDHVIDLYDLRNDQTAISYEAGELFVDSSKIKGVFPPAISV